MCPCYPTSLAPLSGPLPCGREMPWMSLAGYLPGSAALLTQASLVTMSPFPFACEPSTKLGVHCFAFAVPAQLAPGFANTL